MNTEASIEDCSLDGLAGRTITTQHYRLYADLGDREFEDGLPEFLETAYREYTKTLPEASSSPNRMTVYLFATRSAWEAYTRKHFPRFLEHHRHGRSSGFTEGTTIVAYLTDRATTLATLAHEGWRQYMNAQGPVKAPAWLNEGLACYHEAVQYKRGRPWFTPEGNAVRIGQLRDAVQRDELFSFKELTSIAPEEVLREDNSTITNTYYAQLWAAVMFLRHGAGNRCASGFQRMMADLSTGQFGAQVRATEVTGISDGRSRTDLLFPCYFGRTAEELDKPYYDYLVRTLGY